MIRNICGLLTEKTAGQCGKSMRISQRVGQSRYRVFY